MVSLVCLHGQHVRERSVLRGPVCWFVLACLVPLLFFVFSVQGLVVVSKFVIRIASGAMHMGKSASHPPLRQCGECHK